MASELQFSVTYDGRDAAAHRIDMRRYGRALVGIDRMVNTGLLGLAERKIPRGRQTLRLQIDMTPPSKGSVAILGMVMAAYQGAQPWLPFVIDEIREKGFDIVWTWLAASFKVLGGREKDAHPDLERLMDFMNEIDERHTRDRQHEREAHYEDAQRQREFIRELIESQRYAARDAVSPVGTSASSLFLGRTGNDRITEVDEVMAASVRADFPIVVGDLEHVEVEFDGFRRSARHVWVRRVGVDDNWIRADVRDPVFMEVENPYSEAAATGRRMRVAAKPTFRDGSIYKLFILHAA